MTTQRITPRPPGLFKQLLEMNTSAKGAAIASGVDEKLIELIKIRASQINGCAFCLDMHARDARKIGETDRRIDLLPAWRETDLYTEAERAALALTESITRLSETADVPDDVYDAAKKQFDNAQFGAIIWVILVINTFNRLNVTGRTPVPE